MNPGARRHPPPQVGAGHPGYRWGALPDVAFANVSDAPDGAPGSLSRTHAQESAGASVPSKTTAGGES